jgi:hypothetical protein
MNDDELSAFEEVVRKALAARARRTSLRNPHVPGPAPARLRRPNRRPVAIFGVIGTAVALVVALAFTPTSHDTSLRVDNPPSSSPARVRHGHQPHKRGTPVSHRLPDTTGKSRLRCRRTGAVVATTVVIAVGAAGCGSINSSSSSRSTPTTITATTITPTTITATTITATTITPTTITATTTTAPTTATSTLPTTTVASTSTTSTSTSVPLSATTTTSPPAKTFPCTATQIKITYAGKIGAQGTLTYFFKADNISSVTCNVEGYFGYAAYDKAGKQIGKAGSPSGLTWNFNKYKTHLIIVKAGATVWTAAMSADDTSDAGSCQIGVYWKLILPNTTAPEHVPGMSDLCSPIRIFGTLITTPSGL